MSKKYILLSFFLLIGGFLLNSEAQTVENTVNDRIFERVHVPERLPVPMPYLREADMFWTKRIWRVIDLREKQNHPLYFPSTPIGDRKSLSQTIFDAVYRGEITAYKNDDFTRPEPMTYDEVKAAMGAVDKVQVGKTLTGADTVMTQKGEIISSEIKEYWLKEEWFFDKNSSTFGVRILAICPIRHYQEVSSAGIPMNRKGSTFWIYFDQARHVFVRAESYNEANDARRLTFDDIFLKRMFSSFILKEANVQDNRLIRDYAMGGVQAQMESERIKMEIFEMEHDLWEY